MSNWKREKCNCRRNYGREYISDKTGQIVGAKILGTVFMIVDLKRGICSCRVKMKQSVDLMR